MDFCCNVEDRKLAKLQVKADCHNMQTEEKKCPNATQFIVLEPIKCPKKCTQQAYVIKEEPNKCCKKTKNLPKTVAVCKFCPKKKEKKCCKKDKTIYPETFLVCFEKPKCEKKLKRCPSRELRGGTLYRDCFCEKKYGLQDNCPRTGCHGSPECLTKPRPTCCPSQKCHVSRWEKKFPNIRCGRNLDEQNSVSKKNDKQDEYCFLAFVDDS